MTGSGFALKIKEATLLSLFAASALSLMYVIACRRNRGANTFLWLPKIVSGLAQMPRWAILAWDA